MIQLKKIRTKYPINIGAPTPRIISDDNDLTLLFYVDLIDYAETTNKVKERDSSNDIGVAKISFNLFYSYTFGVPSDEVIIGHRYYDFGLKPYSMYVVEDSDWLKEIIRINSKHPYFNKDIYTNLKHYILTFKDNTFECIAKEYSIDYSLKSLDQVFRDCAEGFAEDNNE